MRALIVEDDPVKGRRIKEIFDQESCTVDIVEGASDCLDRLRDVAYEIVVLDLLIPWESGILDDLPDRNYSRSSSSGRGKYRICTSWMEGGEI